MALPFSSWLRNGWDKPQREASCWSVRPCALRSLLSAAPRVAATASPSTARDPVLGRGCISHGPMLPPTRGSAKHHGRPPEAWGMRVIERSPRRFAYRHPLARRARSGR